MATFSKSFSFAGYYILSTRQGPSAVCVDDVKAVRLLGDMDLRLPAATIAELKECTNLTRIMFPITASEELQEKILCVASAFPHCTFSVGDDIMQGTVPEEIEDIFQLQEYFCSLGIKHGR